MRLRVVLPGVAALLVIAAACFALRHQHHAGLRIVETPRYLPADGRFHPAGKISPSDHGPLVPTTFSIRGLPARLVAVDGGGTMLEVQSPVLPGERTVHVSARGTATTLKLNFVPDTQDTFGNGTPDFLRLHTAEDRAAFRGWFTALAETAASLPPGKLPAEIGDCAALLRWCYRNALHAHDETWLREVPGGVEFVLPSVRQYVYPLTPLGAGLFRVREGTFAPSDESNGAFAQFADARTLWRLNTFFVSRNVQSARPGDLLFYRQLEQNSPYHSMIVTGSGEQWAIYHTGPIGPGPGEMRRVLLNDLLHHPDSRWRPIVDNSNFLGVYRWNILEEDLR